MTTQNLVNALLKESKEVRSSVGGTPSFRTAMDFVLNNASEVNEEALTSRRRSAKEIATLMEATVKRETIENAKSVYAA